MTPESAHQAPAWRAQRERGARFMLRLLIWVSQLAGRGFARLILYPITAYYLVAARAAVRASREFLTRAEGRPATLPRIARHIHTFASVVLDRMLFAYGGTRGVELREFRDPAERAATYGSPRGSLLFVSHLGSFELLRVIGVDRAPMKFLLDREHGRVLTAMLGAANPGLAASIIDATQPGPALVLAVRQALDGGYRIGIMVDRPGAGERTVAVPFLGAPAHFPIGPWQLAAALQARVVLGFCLYRGGNRYEGHFELFTEKLAVARERRAAQLEDCVRRYAGRLEHFARLAPDNWFNFYDFWGAPRADATARH